MPISSKPAFTNQVATARWRAASTTALFVLLPDLKDTPDVSWEAQADGGLAIAGPGWTDDVRLAGDVLQITSDDGIQEVPLAG